MSSSQDAGNTAAIREALEYLCSISDLDLSELEVLGKRLENTSTYGGGLVLKLVHGVRNGQKTLAAPPRNCDVGTVAEQCDRHLAICLKHAGCATCPRNRKNISFKECILSWAQEPYTEVNAK